MSQSYGSRWTIKHQGYRLAPSHTPNILIQVESGGLDDADRQYRQYIEINGAVVLNANSPRSYRITRLTYGSSGWSYNSSYGYDVYGSSVNATSANTYLTGFNTGDILVLNTNDEPNNNRTIFRDTLVNDFKASLQYDPRWESRCSYVLIAVKGKGVIYEDMNARYDDRGTDVSLWLG